MGPLAVCIVAANVVDKTRRSLVLFFDCPPRLCDALRQDFVRLSKAGKVSRRARSVRPSAVCESDVILRHIVKPRVAVFNAAWSQHPPATLPLMTFLAARRRQGSPSSQESTSAVATWALSTRLCLHLLMTSPETHHSSLTV
ncbi:hypothetical protein CTRI78_v001729 [Colletotrichum trifolii]|uniref:Uncharacterized protein n=1 Tax=Colletotrichum trifolii TaxID=5466 RepID=A0A4R8RNN7_COLTR|nr:hypothetical protein CTRI78_v001729 [Colletotrichum trifolii]